ncbi:glutamine--tRNA ligase/YqeY domain fusion protein [Dethiobacter alkaliphilus]|uniref:glutamine--tRNA ligase/YqeY domain fusion protein n=1 Tax=Dethiobacter alkaliphilus TaxID=427926 RepID=UPI0022276DFF|nr:glutamine--tRNA ligase/YqeY domain fusion protein [Dethiobacter alkaliphilus]MCW3490657.1 glutamine--tRNA ligase/YqeY domain fusion protein [Dethiobacter alkaliphilus]
MSNETEVQTNFIHNLIKKDVEEGKNNGAVHTRFPPEPNGYLHIGHAKAVLLNYNLAKTFNGKFNVRFDDTNPIKEEQEFVDSILEDLRWLGVDWEDRLFFTSDSFEIKYEFAQKLIKAGRAYVCDLDPEQIREYRGTLTEPGKNSPYRDRSAEENLDLFERMRQGEFPNGSKVLRAKIDMSSGNLNMRDPVIYRILHAHHHRTGDKWCIYPMYDFDHPFTDSLEGITHSLCSIEYSDHRPLYDWIVDNALELMPEVMKSRSQQTEFARLNMTYTVMSKRKLRRLVEEKHVEGWDDPRMPTIAGLRRRGITPAAIADFQERVGVARADSTVDLAMFEHCIREDLGEKAHRMMAVLDPLKVVITNWPEDKAEMLELENMPGDESAGTRQVPFGREIYIEQEDFMEEPPKKFHRLAPGKEVRLKGAYVILCEEVIKDANGKVVELRCTYDPQTKSGQDTSGKKVKGVIHWVSAKHAEKITVRMYDNLFTKENPEDEENGDFLNNINPDSLITLTDIPAEPAIAEAPAGSRFQFMRKGYFYLDHVDAAKGNIIYNRIVGLRDTWAKKNK